MRLNHNMASLGLFNNYKKNLVNNSSALAKVSSGVKINAAKDNPSKVGQSENMRIQIKSLQAAQRNAQDTSSMIQAADGALQEVNNTLVRMKELAVKAGSGAYSDDERAAVQKELDQMKANIDSLAKNTSFNGVKLLDNENVPSNEYPVYKDAMIGAMEKETVRIPMFNIETDRLKDDNGNSLKDIDVSTEDGVGSSLSVIDASIKTISSIRSKYGALQSRLESTGENLDDTILTVTKADSNLRDADIALEMSEFARTQILNDTALALMAQSNKLPQDSLRAIER